MPRASNTFDDFLNPKSMLTPGLAGSMTMVITNALVTQFGASPAYTALIISALFGIVVFAATAAALWLRGVLYVLNSLLIFSVALGANQLGVNAAASSDAPAAPDPVAGPAPPARPVYFANWLDGTTSKRQELLGSLDRVEDRQAIQVLQALDATPLELSNPRAALAQRSAHARTAEQVADIRLAIDRTAVANQPRRND